MWELQIIVLIMLPPPRGRAGGVQIMTEISLRGVNLCASATCVNECRTDLVADEQHDFCLKFIFFLFYFIIFPTCMAVQEQFRK